MLITNCKQGKSWKSYKGTKVSGDIDTRYILVVDIVLLAVQTSGKAARKSKSKMNG